MLTKLFTKFRPRVTSTFIPVKSKAVGGIGSGVDERDALEARAPDARFAARAEAFIFFSVIPSDLFRLCRDVKFGSSGFMSGGILAICLNLTAKKISKIKETVKRPA